MNTPILIYSDDFSTESVSRWIRLGFICEIEAMNHYETVRRFTTIWDSARGVLLYENSEPVEDSIEDIINKHLTCRALVYAGYESFPTTLKKLKGYLLAKSIQCIPKSINRGQSVRLPQISFVNHRIILKKKTIFLYHSTGLIALEYFPDLLKKSAEGMTTVMVTGTNGKTTVTKMLSGALKSMGIRTTSNNTGANLLGGISTSLIENLRFGKPRAKHAVIECDEAWAIDIAPVIKPEIIIVTNISIDSDLQFQRFPGIGITQGYIERAINESNPKYVICPEGLQLNVHNGRTTIVRYRVSDNVRSVIPGKHNIQNAAAACTCLQLMGFDSEAARNAVFNTTAPYGRFDTFDIEGKKATLIYAKNSAGIEAALDYLISLGEKINLILYMNDDEDSNGNRIYSGWLTDGLVSDKLKKLDCSLAVGGKLTDNMYGHYLSEEISPIQKLPSVSSVISNIAQSDRRTYIIYERLWGELRIYMDNKYKHC